MIPEPQQEQPIRRALLGLGPFEEGWEPDAIEFVAETLVDEYLGGDLSPADQKRFESYFLRQPGNQERLAFARALDRNLRSSGRWTLRLGIAAATLAASVVLYWQSAVVTIAPGVMRDADTQSSSVSRYLPVRLRLLLPRECRPGPGEALAQNGESVVWRRPVTLSRSGPVEVWVAPFALPAGEFNLQLTEVGTGDVVASYIVRVK